MNGTINLINKPADNERRWNRGGFRLKDPANAGGIIINAAKRFGWSPADAFDDEARAAYGRSLYTDDQRRQYGRRLHEERVDNWWNDQADGFQAWKDQKKNPQNGQSGRRSEAKEITLDELRARRKKG